MVEVNVPFSVSYQTVGLTPISDVIDALKATDALMQEAVSLLPSLIHGLRVEGSSLNVRRISQESPLKEIFGVALFLAFQDDLEAEVPPLLEDILNISISDRYDTIVTVVFLMVVFYGASFAKDAALKMVSDHKVGQKLDEMVWIVSQQTGKADAEIRAILDSKFGKHSSVKKWVSNALTFFVPSKKAENAPVMVDRDELSRDLVRDVPSPVPAERVADYDRYQAMSGVEIEIHAMDKDKSATGWAAVVPSVSDRRLKMKVVDPLSPSDLFGQSSVVGDIVVISKLTADGFVPNEIHLTALKT
ncbi:MAG: hypothetical protein WAT09_08565 [Paracoccaceae bacterium]